MRRPNGLEFEGTAQTVGSLALASNPAGLVLGHDQNGVAVTLQLFRAEPTRILLVDQGWLERVLVLRALAVGARVVMQTPDAQLWAQFGESVTGTRDRFHVAPPYQSVTAPGSVSQPTLFVAERHPLDLPALGPWQAQLTVAAWFGEYVAQSLQSADLVILRRLSAREMAAAAALMHVDALQAAALQATPADGLVMYQSGVWRYVRLVSTAVEQRLFGAPR
jgi:hypothetical protein